MSTVRDRQGTLGWAAFNDHLAGMSDQELGQRLNKVKSTPWANNWRWKGFGDRMKIEFDKRSEPWTHWNEFPEERVGMGTSYINRQLESGQSIEDIKQNAADKNWIVGPDALNKFYGLNDRQQHNLQLHDKHLQEDRARRFGHVTKWFEDKKASGWDPYVAQGHPPRQNHNMQYSSAQVKQAFQDHISGPTNVLKINRDKTNTSTNTTKKSKKQKDTYTQPTFANTLTL